MKKIYASVAAICAVLMLSPTMAAEPKADAKPAGKPAGAVVGSAKVTATVTAIDYKARTVKLKDEKGNETELVVGPAATRFNEVKKGDVVTFEYLESVAIEVTPKGAAAPAAGEAAYVEKNKPSQGPGGVAVRTATMTATVEAIDYKTRKITLKGPQGNSRSFTVGPEAKRFNEVKKGDQVTISYTEATAINVTKPAKKK
jgi:hypothetical protein